MEADKVASSLEKWTKEYMEKARGAVLSYKIINHVMKTNLEYMDTMVNFSQNSTPEQRDTFRKLIRDPPSHLTENLYSISLEELEALCVKLHDFFTGERVYLDECPRSKFMLMNRPDNCLALVFEDRGTENSIKIYECGN